MKFACSVLLLVSISQLWEIPEENHKPGLAMHTVGWPMERTTYGGEILQYISLHELLSHF